MPSSQPDRASNQPGPAGTSCSPGSGATGRVTSHSAASTGRCSRNTGRAARPTPVTSRCRPKAASRGISSVASPACASARATVAAEGGSRFDAAAPRTPTAVPGKPATSTRNSTAALPPAASSQPVAGRSGRRASATPSCQGTHQPVTTAVAARVSPPSGAATASTTGTATAAAPSRASNRTSSGVAASRVRWTPRNHSGLSDRTTTVRTTLCAVPCTARAAATTATPPASTATGPASARTRRHHQRSGASAVPARLRAAPNPATRKNRPRVWNSQLTGARPVIVRSGLSSRTTPSAPRAGAVTSQCPSTTPAMATTRSASVPVSRRALTVPPLTVPPLTVPPLTVPPLTVPPPAAGRGRRR